MYILIHLRSDGTVNWSSTLNPFVPVELLAENELGIVIHPLDVKLGIADTDTTTTEGQG